MSDNLQKAGQQDRNRINLHEEWEVRHWTEALGVSREELEKAVSEVGVSADAVRQHLKRK
jgi:pyrroloquinoline quinone (PQQ) biosynthesis protein C